MRKEMLFVAALMSAGSMNAATVVADGEYSLHIEQMQEVVVKGVKAQKDAPFAIANVAGKDLQSFSKTGRELPFLFSQTPGVVAWSENGLGTGTTYMRIRGAAGSRVNVTLDGVPMNSPEDQCVFWANMNSYGSLLGGNVYQWRRRFWRYGGLNVKISFGNSVARAVYFIRLVQHI